MGKLGGVWRSRTTAAVQVFVDMATLVNPGPSGWGTKDTHPLGRTTAQSLPSAPAVPFSGGLSWGVVASSRGDGYVAAPERLTGGCLVGRVPPMPPSRMQQKASSSPPTVLPLHHWRTPDTDDGTSFNVPSYLANRA